MAALGAVELADMFNTIVKLCELDEQRQAFETGYSGQLEGVDRPGSGFLVRPETGGAICYTRRNDSAIMTEGCV